MYECLNACLMSDQITESTKKYVQLVFVSALVNGCESRAKSALISTLKKWARFSKTRPSGQNLFKSCIDVLYEWDDLQKLQDDSADFNPLTERCKFGNACNNPDCLYDHEVTLSWSLNLGTLIQEDDEELLAFTYRVKEVLNSAKALQKPETHECMEILSVISMLNGCHPQHANKLKDRFLFWINNPKSRGSVFNACHDIFLQYDSELFTKTQVLSKRQIKKAKKCMLGRKCGDSNCSQHLQDLVATYQEPQAPKRQQPIKLGASKPILPIAPPPKSRHRKTKDKAFIKLPRGYQSEDEEDPYEKLFVEDQNSETTTPHKRNRDELTEDEKPDLSVQECPFGAGCVRLDCPYFHERTKKHDSPQRILPACKFGRRCHNKSCVFGHPPELSASRSKIPCRYGLSCKRPDCYYEH